MAINLSRELVKRTVENSVESIKTALNEIISENTSSASSIQKVNITIGKKAKYYCGDVHVRNVNRANISALSQANNSELSTFSDTVVDKVSETMKNEIEQMNKGFALGLFNISSTVTDTVTKNRTNIKESIVNKYRDSITTTVSSTQIIELVVESEAEFYSKGDCEWLNQSELGIFAQMFTRHVVENIMQLDSMTDIKNTFEKRNKQSNTGLDLNIFGVLGIIIAIVVLFFLLK